MIQRIESGKQHLAPNFIGSWIIQSDLCDQLVSYFEKNEGKQVQGSTSSGVNLKTKDRVDISIAPNEIKLPENKIFKIYFDSLFDCYKDYNIQWPFLKKWGRTLKIGSFNLGRYNQGQHFQKEHCERDSLKTLHRLFAFMTYLNDVEEGGSTYFKHYDLEIQPKKGLTLIWPAEWTHIHNGNVIKKGTKYIITGWIYFPE